MGGRGARAPAARTLPLHLHHHLLPAGAPSPPLLIVGVRAQGMRLLDANKKFRALIAEDGTVQASAVPLASSPFPAFGERRLPLWCPVPSLFSGFASPRFAPLSLAHRCLLVPQDSQGTTLGFIEPNGDVGTHDMDFLGHADPKSGQVTNRSDEVRPARVELPLSWPTRARAVPQSRSFTLCSHLCAHLCSRLQVVGEFDQGRGYIKDAKGSVVAEITKEGVLSGNAQTTAGFVQGFTFQSMVTVAAYILLIDPKLTAGARAEEPPSGCPSPAASFLRQHWLPPPPRAGY